MSDEPTDQDLIAGHPFTPATFRDAWPGICGYLVDGWPCGFAADEHQGALEGADGEGGGRLDD